MFSIVTDRLTHSLLSSLIELDLGTNDFKIGEIKRIEDNWSNETDGDYLIFNVEFEGSILGTQTAMYKTEFGVIEWSGGKKRVLAHLSYPRSLVGALFQGDDFLCVVTRTEWRLDGTTDIYLRAVHHHDETYIVSDDDMNQFGSLSDKLGYLHQ